MKDNTKRYIMFGTLLLTLIVFGLSLWAFYGTYYFLGIVALLIAIGLSFILRQDYINLTALEKVLPEKVIIPPEEIKSDPSGKLTDSLK